MENLVRSFKWLHLLREHMTWVYWVLCIGLIASFVWGWRAYLQIHQLQINLKDQEMQKTMAQQAAKLLDNVQEHFDKEKETLFIDIRDKEIEIESLRTEVSHQKGRAQSAHSSKGQLLEKWTPFLTHEEIEPQWKPEDWSFLGNPLDYVVWEWYNDKIQNIEEGKVVLLDVKSAKSQLSTKQRRIRDLIKAGKVEWREIRLD